MEPVLPWNCKHFLLLQFSPSIEYQKYYRAHVLHLVFTLGYELTAC